MNKIYISLLLFFLSSCLPRISYLGNSYSSTKEPDFYVEEKNITRPYQIIGKGYPQRFALFPAELLQRKAIQKAKDKGADAVLIQDFFVRNDLANISSVYRADSAGKAFLATPISDAGDFETRFIILFLKYTDH